MQAYHELLQHILDNGVRKDDRTGVGTISVFGYQMHIDLSEGFPLLTTKKVHYKSIVHELLWFLRGDTNIRYLVENGVRIWNEWPFQFYLKSNGKEDALPKYSPEWKAELKIFEEKIKADEAFAKEWGELGPVYGRQWRDFAGIDQIKGAIEQLKRNPNSRRHIVTAWNPQDIPAMAQSGLPPCHVLFQFYVAEGKLSCQLYQRSADVFLGVPFNIASYALLTMMMAQVCELKPGTFVHTFGDVHLYTNHIDQARLQLTRKPRKLPMMKINEEVTDLFGFTYSDFELTGYDPHPAIRAQVAV